MKLIERVSPSVVDITNLRVVNNTYVISHGTGSILHEAGYVVTNAHVVVPDGQKTVTLSGGTVYPYRIVAKLPYEDLALIKIDAKTPLAPVRLGRSHDLMLGEDVLAVGNSQGLAACRQGRRVRRVRFFTAASPVNRLEETRYARLAAR